MFKEFRDFLMRGNVVDLAVAVVIGAAFGAVINSFVTDILTPLLGVIGVPDFRELSIQAGEATISYGLFLNALISFILIAAAIFFFVVRPMNAMAARRAAGAPPEEPTTKACPFCMTDIPVAATRCPNCTSQLSGGTAG
ncbi:MAG TPA: large conductance mechanosensitive channel protein MscL [Candidatus Limnocylindria bacterium]